MFYNARINYENNKKGLFSYFSRMNCLHLLTDTLDFLKDKDLIKGESWGNKSKGTNATEPVNNFARALIKYWLISPVNVIEKGENNQPQETTIPKLMTIKNLALLKELSEWSIDGNYDRVSALGMLMLLREDRLVVYKGDVKNKRDRSDDPNYLGNNEFFKQYD